MNSSEKLKRVRVEAIRKITGAFTGRVVDYLNSLPRLPAEPLYYLCGSSEMVVEARDILIKRGVPFRKIVGEIYF